MRQGREVGHFRAKGPKQHQLPATASRQETNNLRAEQNPFIKDIVQHQVSFKLYSRAGDSGAHEKDMETTAACDAVDATRPGRMDTRGATCCHGQAPLQQGCPSPSCYNGEGAAVFSSDRLSHPVLAPCGCIQQTF